MKKYVSLDKRSKKAQREYHAKQRRTWGELNPVTRIVPSGKTYNRKKEKQRIGKEFRNGFDADLFLFASTLCWAETQNSKKIGKRLNFHRMEYPLFYLHNKVKLIAFYFG